MSATADDARLQRQTMLDFHQLHLHGLSLGEECREQIVEWMLEHESHLAMRKLDPHGAKFAFIGEGSTPF